MNQEAFAKFTRLLADIMASYGKPLPDTPIVQAWWRELQPFGAAVIQQAFIAYKNERPDIAPVPNSIAARCRLLDGRPDENEAWAVALTTRGEEDTVVWRRKCAMPSLHASRSWLLVTRLARGWRSRTLTRGWFSRPGQQTARLCGWYRRAGTKPRRLW